jgi:hypothetical protein
LKIDKTTTQIFQTKSTTQKRKEKKVHFPLKLSLHYRYLWQTTNYVNILPKDKHTLIHFKKIIQILKNIKKIKNKKYKEKKKKKKKENQFLIFNF